MKVLGICILTIVAILILFCFIRTLISKKRTVLTNLFSIIFAIGIGFLVSLCLFSRDAFNIAWNWYNNIFHIVG